MSDSSRSTRSETLDQALRLIPAPVTVVGVRKGAVLGGLTAAWVTRVSIDPALLLVSIGHQRHTRELLEGAGQFTISVLADDQVGEARLFGLKSRTEVDKWAQVDHDLLGEGIPALRHCTSRFLCQVKDIWRTGDHDCFVGEIITADVVAGAPALPMRGADYAPGRD